VDIREPDVSIFMLNENLLEELLGGDLPQLEDVSDLDQFIQQLEFLLENLPFLIFILKITLLNAKKDVG